MEIDVIIEDPEGSTVRNYWDKVEERWVVKPHPHSDNPWPANYGNIPGTFNSADNNELDVLVLSTSPLATGSEVRVRAVGLLMRPDGDDKVIGILVDDPEYGQIQRFNEVPAREIEAIEQWFATWSQVGQWRDEHVARQRIHRAMALSR
jgi:inorganic pyrophosphatase